MPFPCYWSLVTLLEMMFFEVNYLQDKLKMILTKALFKRCLHEYAPLELVFSIFNDIIEKNLPQSSRFQKLIKHLGLKKSLLQKTYVEFEQKLRKSLPENA